MKILVRLPNWLGDMVMSTVFIQSLRELYPDAVIHIIAKQELIALAALIPGINYAHPFSKKEHGGLSGVWRFGKKFKAEKFDLFFSLPDSFSSAIMARATAAAKRVGFRKEGRSLLLTHTYSKPADLHRADEYLFLLEKFTGRKSTAHASCIQIPPQLGPDNLILINFNSEASSRRLPPAKARSLLTRLLAALPDARFGFIGSAKEQPYVNQLLEGFPADRLTNYAGRTNLEHLAALMASAKLMLSTDSGPAHLANSLNTPVIVLFGPGNERNTAPYNKQQLSVIRAGVLPCEPCVKNECVLYGTPRCLELLNEEQIIQKVKLYLGHA